MCRTFSTEGEPNGDIRGVVCLVLQLRWKALRNTLRPRSDPRHKLQRTSRQRSIVLACQRALCSFHNERVSLSSTQSEVYIGVWYLGYRTVWGWAVSRNSYNPSQSIHLIFGIPNTLALLRIQFKTLRQNVIISPTMMIVLRIVPWDNCWCADGQIEAALPRAILQQVQVYWKVESAWQLHNNDNGLMATSDTRYSEENLPTFVWNKSCVACSTGKRKCDGLRPCRCVPMFIWHITGNAENPPDTNGYQDKKSRFVLPTVPDL